VLESLIEKQQSVGSRVAAEDLGTVAKRVTVRYVS